MHVVIASHDVYPDPGSGGTGRYVYETARRLVDRGHDVTVVTRRRGGDGEGEVPRRETLAGFEIARYEISVANTPGPAVLAQLPAAARAVADAVPERPDLLSCQGPVTATLADRAIADAVPRHCTFHSPWPTEYHLRTRDSGRSTIPGRREANALVRDCVERRLLGRTDEVAVLSEFMRSQLRERYAPDAPTYVLPGGVDADTFSPDAARDDFARDGILDADGPSVLTVRRLSPRMGHGLLLDAFATVRERVPDAELYIAGDGPLAEPLRERAAALGVDDATTFLGYVPDANLPATYANADVFALPTLELEGFGLATLEALAAGTPVVGTPVGATPELLEPLQTHDDVPRDLLLPSVDADALAAALVDWLGLDDATRRNAGRACREYARDHYSWEHVVDDLEARYRALAARDGDATVVDGSTTATTADASTAATTVDAASPTTTTVDSEPDVQD